MTADESGDQEILFIGHTEMVEENPSQEVVTKTLSKSTGVSARIAHGNRFEVPREAKVKEVVNIRAVDKAKVDDKRWATLGTGGIVVDSAADESCWPKDQGGAFPTRPSKKNIVLMTANGGKMGHYGEKEVTFRNDGSIVGLRFQVTDVKKPLLAVRRLVEKGNVVRFGPKPGESYIANIETGKRIPMERKGHSFVTKAEFVRDLSEAESVFSRRVQ